MPTNRKIRRIVRWGAVTIGTLAVGATTFGVVNAAQDDEPTAAPPATSTSTTEAPTTTTTAPPTTTTTEPEPPSDVLGQGSSGPEVEDLQARLTAMHIDPGPVDGKFGLATMYGVQAFQKLNGLPPSGTVGPAERQALAAPAAVAPLVPDGGADRVEVDLPRQLLFLYRDGDLRLISHVSTANGERFCENGVCKVSETPVGGHRFSWRASGWWDAPLGRLYNPVYFTSRGHAVHGSLSVPTYPASHGCVRIPMHIAEYFPTLVDRGDPIYVTDGGPVGPAPRTLTTEPPPPATPAPGPDEENTTTTTAPPASTTSTSTPTSTTPTSTTVAPTTETTADPTTTSSSTPASTETTAQPD